MAEIIQTENLVKHFGAVRAVDGISLGVRKGEIYGFLGLNGAGKTTTIRMLLGMVRPTAGKAFLFGKKVNAGTYTVWKDVGYLVEMPYAYPDLTVRENLDIIRTLRRIPDAKSVDTVMAELQLTQYAGRKAKHLSLGNAQRLGLAKALLHHPSLLILDEPANGLDPAGIVEIRALLTDLAANHGVTVFISSHILGEISKLATRIGIIHNGKLLQELDAKQLHSLRQKRLLIQSRNGEALRKFMAEAGHKAEPIEGGGLALTDPEIIDRPEVMAHRLVQAGLPPVFLKVEEEDLETYFLRIIGQSKEAG